MKSISWLACVAAASALCVSVSCSSSSSKPVGGAGESGASGEAGAGTGEGGTNSGEAGAAPSNEAGSAGTGGAVLPPAPTATLCPEPDPINPKNANSVSVQDVVLAADTHWTADKVYLIGDDFKVEHHTLTVDAGTTICLYNSGKIYVGQGIDPGEIHLNGTADKHVTITAFPSADDATKVDAFQGGIQFDTYEGSSLSYVDVWYGGPGGGGASWAFELTDTAQGNDATTPFFVDHLTIGSVQSKAFRVGTPNGIDAASKITVTGFAPHADGDPAFDTIAELNIYAEKSVAHALTTYTDDIPVAVQRMRLNTAAPPLILEHDAEITDIGFPYWYAGGLTIAAPDDNSTATLTVDSGVTLHVDHQIKVGDQHQGDLVLAGTAENPVVLTSSETAPAAGDWDGIYFTGGAFSPTKSKLTYAFIQYAGTNELDAPNHVGRCGDNYYGAIEIASPGGTAYDGPVISNTTISHSLTYGIVSDAGSNLGALSNDYTAAALGNTFTDLKEGNVAIGACTPTP